MNELTLTKFCDSSNQIVLHFLRDLDEYFRIKNVPEPETIGDKVMKANAKMRKKGKSRSERRKTRGTKVKKKGSCEGTISFRCSGRCDSQVYSSV